MKNSILGALVCLGLSACQSPSSPARVETQENSAQPAVENSAPQSFTEQSHEKCKYENSYFFSDEYGNSICSRNYKSASRNNRDVILTFNFMVEPGKGESRRTKECTILSSDQGEKSYLCELGKRYFYIAHYQRSTNKDNRIWLEEIPANQMAKVLKQNHEDVRSNLKKIHGKFELKPESYSKSKEFLSLIKPQQN